MLARVLDQAEHQPGHPAAEDDQRSLTYGELVAEVGDLAAGLDRLGVHDGDCVGLALGNSVDFVSAALACAWLGAVFVPLAVTDPPARRNAVLTGCAPTVVLIQEATVSEGWPASRRSVAEVVQLGREVARQPAPVLEGTGGAYVIYTSGTTGTPKGVLVGRPAFAAAVDTTADLLGMDRRTRALCVSPFHFDGSFGTVFPVLVAGGSLVIPPRESLLFPQRFIRAVRRHHVTHTGFSPSYLRLLLASPATTALGDADLHTVALGGEACSAADVLALWAVAPQIRVFNRYGPTETTIAVTHVELDRQAVDRGPIGIGQPHPGVSFHLVDDDGKVLAGRPVTGELHIGGVQLMTGYLGDADLTAEVLRDDVVEAETVYRTGDVVLRDERGDYVYLDRKDRVVKRSGVRISLLEVASALRQANGVREATAVAYDDDGQLGIVAFVVTGAALEGADLRRSLAERLPPTMLPDTIRFVDALPMTSASKVDERRLLEETGLGPYRPA